MIQRQKREKPVERQRGVWDEERTRGMSVRPSSVLQRKSGVLTQRKGERKCYTDVFELKEKKKNNSLLRRTSFGANERGGWHISGCQD